MNMTQAMIARISAWPMTDVPAICRPGTTPVRFRVTIRKKKDIRIGMKRRPSFSPRVSMMMLFRTKPRANSVITWPRPGTSFIRRTPSPTSRSSTATPRRRINMIRFSSNGVPSNSTAGGKKSVIDGGTKPLAAMTAGTRWGIRSVSEPMVLEARWGRNQTASTIPRRPRPRPTGRSAFDAAHGDPGPRDDDDVQHEERHHGRDQREEQHHRLHPGLRREHEHRDDEERDLHEPAAEQHGERRDGVRAREHPSGDEQAHRREPEEEQREDRADEARHEAT